MMGWQWHQLDHMQIIYTLLQTDNHYLGEPVPEETFTHSPILIIIQPLPASSIYCDPQHPPFK